MIIPKKYGGLEFSAYAHSCVLVKVAGRSATASSTIAVPNSLGPAELLNHYGTEEQKNHYLPRLARGEEVPCFALTGPRAGSDAASLPDTGIVCKGLWQGREIVGLKLNFSKRYITLAPIATVVGLAFRMFDPDKLLGGEERPRHHLRADPAQHAGHHHRPAALSAQHSLSERARSRVAMCSCRSIASSAGRRWRARAGACWSSSCRSGAASRCLPMQPAAPRRRAGLRARMRASAGSSTCRSASSKVSRR